jgi:hypothetical protein
VCKQCGFVGGGGSGGGNLSGDLTAPFLPRASGAHTLVDSPIEDISPAAGTPQVRMTGLDAEFRGVVDHIQTQVPMNFSGYATRGTVASPTSVANGDGLARVSGLGYDGSDYQAAASMRIEVDGAPAGGVPGAVRFFTADADGGEELGFSVDAAHRAVSHRQLVVEGSSRVLKRDLSIVAGAVAVNAYLSDFFALTVDQDVTISNPTNVENDRRFVLRLFISGDGHTITWGSKYRFANDTEPTIPSSEATYYLGFIYHEVDDRWDCAGPIVGPFGGV